MLLLKASTSRDLQQNKGLGFGACRVRVSSPDADGGRDPLPKPALFLTCNPVHTREPLSKHLVITVFVDI